MGMTCKACPEVVQLQMLGRVIALRASRSIQNALGVGAPGRFFECFPERKVVTHDRHCNPPGWLFPV